MLLIFKQISAYVSTFSACTFSNSIGLGMHRYLPNMISEKPGLEFDSREGKNVIRLLDSILSSTECKTQNMTRKIPLLSYSLLALQMCYFM